MTTLKTIKNWCYGAKTPDIEQAVSDAIFLAHQYRNRLCELELEKRKRHEELLQRLAPDYVAACTAVDSLESTLGELRDRIQTERVKQRTKKPKGVDAITDEIKTVKDDLAKAREIRKQTKQSSYDVPIVKNAMANNAETHKAACADAKRDSGLYWGTEAVVRESCKSFSQGAPPRFKRYDGEGQVSVQLQGGLDCELWSRRNTLCFIENVDGKHADCLIRIASENRKPVFARVPIIFHRPLPDGAIKSAFLERRKIASHVRWSIRLTIESVMPTDRCRDGEVAIHTGWKMESSGLRVATWLGSDGKSGVLRLPKEHCDDYLRVDDIRSRRDVAFNEMIEALKQWCSQHRQLPEWLAEAKKHMHLWKSPARLSKLCWQWSEDRIDGDEDIFAKLNDWRKTDKHRWQHERRLSVRITRRRKHAFRNFAHQLAESYGVAFVSPIDAKALTENSDPEDLERDNTASHRHAKWAAVSELTTCIREKFPLHCVDIDPRYITQQCCNCGEISKVSSRKIQCRECGKTIDVDDNAVANTLARGDVSLKNGALLELLEKKELEEEKKQENLKKKQDANRKKQAARKKEKEASLVDG